MEDEFGAELPQGFTLIDTNDDEFGADLPEGFSLIDDKPAPSGDISTVSPDTAPETPVAAPQAQPETATSTPASPAADGPVDLGTFGNAALQSTGPQNLELGSHSAGAFADLMDDPTEADKYVAAGLDLAAQLRKGIAPNRVRRLQDIESWRDLDDFFFNALGEGVGSMAPQLVGAGAGAVGSQFIPGARMLGKYGKVAGGFVGALGASQMQNIGSMRETLIEEGVTDRKLRGKWAMIGGSAMSALDSLLPTNLVSRFTGPVRKNVQRALIKRMASGAWEGAKQEALTEGAQEALEELLGKGVSGNEVELLPLLDKVINGAVQGGITGGVIKGGSEIIAPTQSKSRELQGRDETVDTPPAPDTVDVGDSLQVPTPAAETPATAEGEAGQTPDSPAVAPDEARQTTQAERSPDRPGGEPRQSPATPEDEALLRGAGFTLGDIYEMSPEQVQEEAARARAQQVEPAEAIPDQEPVRDVFANLADMRDPERPREGVYVAPDTATSLQEKGMLDQANEYGEKIENIDGQGGFAIVANEGIKDRVERDLANGRPFDETIGELTNAGMGKPDGAETVVRQLEGEAVTQERVVAPEEVQETVDEFTEPGRDVDVMSSDEALADRAERVADEEGTPLSDLGPDLPEGFELVDDRPVVETAEDLEAAGEMVETDATQEQKEADDYEKAQVNWQGFDINIETPKGEQRTGTDKDGNQWSVEMPADYGEIEGTTGADGDPLDITIVDPESNEFVIIDQLDADTGQFDETKIFGGATPDTARQTYEQSFSDDRAGERIGAVTKLSVDQLNDWLENGDTTQPYSKDLKPRKKISPDEADSTTIVEEPTEETEGVQDEAPATGDGTTPEPAAGPSRETETAETGVSEGQTQAQVQEESDTAQEQPDGQDASLSAEVQELRDFFEANDRPDIVDEIDRHGTRADIMRGVGRMKMIMEEQQAAGGKWPQPNPYGVYPESAAKKGDRFELKNPKRGWKGGPLADIQLLEVAPGRWLSRYSYQSSISSASSPLSPNFDGYFATRQEALDDAVGAIRKWATAERTNSAESDAAYRDRRKVGYWLDQTFGEAGPVIDAEPVAPKPKKKRKAKQPKPKSLLQYLKEAGGIKDVGGDLKAMDAGKMRPGLINNKTGMEPDEARALAVEAGYLDDIGLIEGTESQSDVNQLLDAIADELGGNKLYALEDRREIEEQQAIEDADEALAANFSEREIRWMDQFDPVDTMRLIEGAREIEIELEHYSDADIARMVNLVSQGEPVDNAIEAAFIYDPDPQEPTDVEEAEPLPFETGQEDAESRSARDEFEPEVPTGRESQELPPDGETGVPAAGPLAESDNRVRDAARQRVKEDYGDITPENWTKVLDENDGALYIRDNITTGGKLWDLIGGKPTRKERQAVQELLPVGTRFRDAGMAVDGLVDGYNDDGAQIVVRYYNQGSMDIPREARKLARRGQESYPHFFVRDGRVIHDSIMDISEVKPVTIDKGPDGRDQLVVPGAEQISEAEQAQRGADQGLQAQADQQPMDIGLFGDSMDQGDLLDLASAPARTGSSPADPRAEFIKNFKAAAEGTDYWATLPNGMQYQYRFVPGAGYTLLTSREGRKAIKYEASDLGLDDLAAEIADTYDWNPGATPLEEIAVDVEADVVDGDPGETETIGVSAADATKQIDQRLNGLFALKRCVLS